MSNSSVWSVLSPGWWWRGPGAWEIVRHVDPRGKTQFGVWNGTVLVDVAATVKQAKRVAESEMAEQKAQVQS